MDAQLKLLENLIYNMLLATDGRTTDMLETMLNEKLRVSVLRQEAVIDEREQTRRMLGDSALPLNWIRESVLIGVRSGLTVSHNIALVHAEHVPPVLFERIASRQEGIGPAISSTHVDSFRRIADYGTVRREEAVDLLGQPIVLRLPDSGELVPYKKYVIYFGLLPGIQLLEYFHPLLVEHRLNQEAGQLELIESKTKEGGSIDET